MAKISEEHIESFLRDGITIVPGVLSAEKIATIKRKWDDELATYGIQHDDLEQTAGNLSKLSSTGGAGGILDIFYANWRMEVAEDPSIFNVMSELWKSTYSSNDVDNFQHPHGCFDPSEGYIYINRVCYRVPDKISKQHAASKKRPLQRSLTPHWDCCPTSMYDSKKKIPRWRPIQCFVALTDNLEPSTGGFEAVPGFHREFTTHFKDRGDSENTPHPPSVCVGDFSPVRTSGPDSDLLKRMEHIPYTAGSLVCWDWRIPHANSYKHVGNVPRRVIYSGLLPNVKMNATYVAEQLKRYRSGELPVDHWQSSTSATHLPYKFHDFSERGEKLMGIRPW